ncbi:MAG: energy coupling factor transporter S component ThiW [Eubacteriales bacterium]|nr:energy coupling factor transporter S component ThiW [Eubacteriales bacterium]
MGTGKWGTAQKPAMAGVLTALAVAGSLLSIPVAGSKCAPVQHMVNVLAAVTLGPWWGVGIAFCASLLRNLLGIGSLLAFPGSMVGALCCGMVCRGTKNLKLTCLAEALGTGVLGGLAAYPVAELLMGAKPAGLFVYVIPFLISTAAGSILAFVLVTALESGGVLERFRMQGGR